MVVKITDGCAQGEFDIHTSRMRTLSRTNYNHSVKLRKSRNQWRKIITLFNISCLLCLTKQNSSSCNICFPQEVFSHTGVLPSVTIFHFVYNQGTVCLKSVVCVLSVTNCYTILKPLHCWLRFPCRLAR